MKERQTDRKKERKHYGWPSIKFRHLLSYTIETELRVRLLKAGVGERRKFHALALKARVCFHYNACTAYSTRHFHSSKVVAHTRNCVSYHRQTATVHSPPLRKPRSAVACLSLTQRAKLRGGNPTSCHTTRSCNTTWKKAKENKK